MMCGELRKSSLKKISFEIYYGLYTDCTALIVSAVHLYISG